MDKIMLSNYQVNIIRHKRKEAKIRTDVLSREIGKGSAYISQIENGKIKRISKETLEMIMEKIGCTYDDLEQGNTDNIYTELEMLRRENETLKEKIRLIKRIIDI